MTHVASSRARIFSYASLGILLAGVFLYSGVSSAHADVYIASSSLTGLYHMEDLTDSSGNGRTMTNTGGAATTTGLLGYAMSMASGTYVKAPNAAMDLSGDFTIGFWISPLTGMNNTPFITRYDGSNGYWDAITYGNHCTSNVLEFQHDNTCYTDAYTLPTSTWIWFLVTRQGSNVDYYVNDNLAFSFSDSHTSNVSSDLCIGAGDTATHSNCISYNHDFYMDELFFMNAHIATSTRDALYNSGTGAEICVTSGCDDAPPPSISSLAQYKEDWTTSIPTGASTTEEAVNFQSFLSASSSDALEMQLELSTSTSFTNLLMATSSTVDPSGSYATTTVSGIHFGSWYWRARAVDTANGGTSTWTEFGGTSTIAFIATSSPVSFVEISDGSVRALYHLENASDSSGNAYTLTNHNSVVFDSGLLNDAADGGSGNTNKYLSVASNLGITGGTMSISVWGKFTGTAASGHQYQLFTHGESTNNTLEQIIAWDNNGTKEVCAYRAKNQVQGFYACYDFNFDDGNWHHYVNRFDGTNTDLYFDGVWRASVASAGTGSGASDYTDVLSDTDQGGSGYWQGLADEAVMTNDVLSTSTIAALYDSGIGAEVCVTSGCGGTFIAPGTLEQDQADGSTPIGEGGTTPDNVVVFKGKLAVAIGTVQLQVEVEPAGIGFGDIPNATSSFVNTNSTASTTFYGLKNQSYHWQARAVNSNGFASNWQSFGTSTLGIDFYVSSLVNAASMQFSATTSDALAYPAAPYQFSATDSSTIEFWYRTAEPTSSVVSFIDTRSPTTSEGYLIKRDRDQGIEFYLACDTGTMDFDAAQNLATNMNGNPTYDTQGVWHQVAITKSTSTGIDAFSFYFDGQPQTITVLASSTISGNCYDASSTNSIWLGKDVVSSSSPNYFTGNMDEVRIWNTARDSSTVELFWNQEINYSDTDAAGIWHFNDTSTDSITGNATSGQNGSPSFASSTPFGHFIYALDHGWPSPNQLASVDTSTTPGEMRWRYDHTGLFDFTATISTSTAAWNALGSVNISSTTATSSLTLDILDESNTSGSVWFERAALWESRINIAPTPTYDYLYLNQDYLLGDSNAALANIVMHELGHALGLDHSTYGNLMYYFEDVNNPVSTIMSQDKSDYYYIWGGQ